MSLKRFVFAFAVALVVWPTMGHGSFRNATSIHRDQDARIIKLAGFSFFVISTC